MTVYLMAMKTGNGVCVYAEIKQEVVNEWRAGGWQPKYTQYRQGILCAMYISKIRFPPYAHPTRICTAHHFTTLQRTIQRHFHDFKKRTTLRASLYYLADQL